MRASHRGMLGIVAVPIAALAAWTPSFVATRYLDEADHATYLKNPVQGWHFLLDAVRAARSTELGTEGQARGRATRYWWPPTQVRVTRVELRYGTSLMRITVPRPDHDRLVRPRSPFTWVVYGRVRNRPAQVIGLLDFHNGRPFWDVRRLTPTGAR